jgi:hypothetical protein
MSKNKKWSPSQKFEIALMAIKNETTINDICKKYTVAPSCLVPINLTTHKSNFLFTNCLGDTLPKLA